jgi:hypothetical protein
MMIMESYGCPVFSLKITNNKKALILKVRAFYIEL